MNKKLQPLFRDVELRGAALVWDISKTFSLPSVHGILKARTLDGLPFPCPGDLPNPRIEPRSPALQAAFLPSEPPGKPLFA